MTEMHENAIRFAEARGQKSPDLVTDKLAQSVSQSDGGADEVQPEISSRSKYSGSMSGFNETYSDGEAPLFMG